MDEVYESRNPDLKPAGFEAWALEALQVGCESALVDMFGGTLDDLFVYISLLVSCHLGLKTLANNRDSTMVNEEDLKLLRNLVRIFSRSPAARLDFGV